MKPPKINMSTAEREHLRDAARVSAERRQIADSGYLDDITDNPLLGQLIAGQRSSPKIPKDINADYNNVVGVAGTSTVAPVAGETSIAPGGSVTFTVGSTGYRSSLVRRLFLDSIDANFGRLTVNLDHSNLKDPMQGAASGFPARCFSPQALVSVEIDVPVDANNTLSVIVTNPTGAAVLVTFGCELD